MPELATPTKYGLPALIFSPLNPASYMKMDVPKLPQDTRGLANAALFQSIGQTLGQLPKKALDAYHTGQKTATTEAIRKEYEDTKAKAATGDEEAKGRLGDFQIDKDGGITVKPKAFDPLENAKKAWYEARAAAAGKTKEPKPSLYDQQSGSAESYPGDPTAPAYELEPLPAGGTDATTTDGTVPTAANSPAAGYRAGDGSVFGRVPDGQGGTKADPNDVADAGVKGFDSNRGAWGAKIQDPNLKAVAVSPSVLQEHGYDIGQNAGDEQGLHKSAAVEVVLPGGVKRTYPIADKNGTDTVDFTLPAYRENGGPEEKNGGHIKGLQWRIVPRSAGQVAQAAPVAPTAPAEPQPAAGETLFPSVDPQTALANVPAEPADDITIQSPDLSAATNPVAVPPGTAARAAQPLATVDMIHGRTAPLVTPDRMTERFNEARQTAGMAPLAAVDPTAAPSTGATAAAPTAQATQNRTGKFKNARTGSVEMWENGRLTNVLLPGANTWRAVKQSAQPKAKEYDTPEALTEEAQAHGLIPDDIQQNPTGKWSALKYKPAPAEPKLDRVMQKQVAELRAEGAPIETKGKTQEEVSSQIAAYHKANETMTDEQIKHIRELRSEYMRDPLFQKYSNVTDGINNAIAASKLGTGIGDKALIEEGQRILNPGTAVAAQTMNNFAHSKGFLEKLSPTYIQEHFTKGAIFTDQQRKDYISIIKGALSNRAHEMDELRDNYLSMSKAARVPQKAAEVYFKNPYEEANARFGKDVHPVDLNQWTPQTGVTGTGTSAAAKSSGAVTMTKGNVTRSVSPEIAEKLRALGWTNAQP